MPDDHPHLGLSTGRRCIWPPPHGRRPQLLLLRALIIWYMGAWSGRQCHSPRWRLKFRPSCIGMHGHGHGQSISGCCPANFNLILLFRCTAQSHAHAHTTLGPVPAARLSPVRVVFRRPKRLAAHGIPSFRPFFPRVGGQDRGWWVVAVGAKTSSYRLPPTPLLHQGPEKEGKTAGYVLLHLLLSPRHTRPGPMFCSNM